jgi:hypothetical protein
MTREEELSKIIIEAKEELYKFEDKRKLEKNSLLINKYYKYRNCHSCPKSDDDKWWLYQKTLKLDENKDLISLFFETDEYGEIKIHEGSGHVWEGWQEISLEEFFKAWSDLLIRINSIEF